MGPSGSGKSTLLTIAGSLEEPTSGEVVRSMERPVSKMSRNDKARLRRRSIGYVFQDFNLLAGLTAVENVVPAPRARRHPGQESPRGRHGGPRGARARRPRVALSRRALRRRAPAGRNRPRRRRRSAPAAGRRALGRARLGQRRGCDAPSSPPASGAWPPWSSPTMRSWPRGPIGSSSSVTGGWSTRRFPRRPRVAARARAAATMSVASSSGRPTRGRGRVAAGPPAGPWCAGPGGCSGASGASSCCPGAHRRGGRRHDPRLGRRHQHPASRRLRVRHRPGPGGVPGARPAAGHPDRLARASLRPRRRHREPDARRSPARSTPMNCAPRSRTAPSGSRCSRCVAATSLPGRARWPSPTVVASALQPQDRRRLAPGWDEPDGWSESSRTPRACSTSSPSSCPDRSRRRPGHRSLRRPRRRPGSIGPNVETPRRSARQQPAQPGDHLARRSSRSGCSSSPWWRWAASPSWPSAGCARSGCSLRSGPPTRTSGWSCGRTASSSALSAR